MPPFWLYTADECLARYIPKFKTMYAARSKAWVRNIDYVATMCKQFENIINLYENGNLQCSCNGKTNLFFNTNEILCENCKKEKDTGGGGGGGGKKRKRKGKAEPKENKEEVMFYPMPKTITYKMLYHVFNFPNSNYKSCLF